jgi:hypothetical protein
MGRIRTTIPGRARTMKNKALFLIMALTLCVGAFLFSTAAYAAADNTPPTVRAWINGDLLHVEAFDDTGVEAAYINSARVNYRVDGSFDLLLRDYAGSDKTISVYAVDFAGNKSNVVELNNPYYTAPTTTPAPTTPSPAPTTPAPTPKPAAPATPSPEPTVSPEPEPTPEPSQSAIPAEQKPFTPDGTGTVVDNVVEQNGKEFFTITTEDDNTFYLIIDRQRDTENVYLLNAVTEADLMALAEKGGTSQSAIPTPEPEVKPTPDPTPTPEPEPEPPAKDKSNGGMILIILLVVAGTGGAGYYFKILKPRQEAAASPDSFEDEDDEDMEYEDDPDYPDYPDYPDTEAYPEDSGEPETDEE